MLDFLASKTDFVTEEIPGRKRAWAARETNLRLDKHNRDGNGNQVHRDNYVEDGELVLVKKCLRPVRSSLALLCYLRDLISLDSENTAVRKFVFKDFTNRIKMTSTLKTLRIY